MRTAGKWVVIVEPIPNFPLLGAASPYARKAPGRGACQRRGAAPRIRSGHRGYYPRPETACAGNGRANHRRIDASAPLCSEGGCRSRAPDGTVLYFDEKHLSVGGARYLLGGSQGNIAEWLAAPDRP
ncbi:SGNH hydrolase domain-containing protein [Aurantiacibacter aquimixticola]|uniref:SGNH hydrolase domain-containing protein n=1 Tax=Aurantiacibacter aquimixticola TaxID=1958945 RepID=UPI003BEF4B14